MHERARYARATNPLHLLPAQLPARGQPCNNGDVLHVSDPHNPYGVKIPCSQGLIVALSEVDPDPPPVGKLNPDVSISIGKRIEVAFDCDLMGLSGLPMLVPGQVPGFTINTQGYDEDTIRGGHYAMWRRLFLQNRNPPDPWNDPTGKQRMADRMAWTGSAARCTEEQKLYDWATNRQNMCPICTQYGFYDPIPECTQSCPDPRNGTCLPAEPGHGAPKMNTGAEAPGAAQRGAACDTAYPCVANGQIATSSGGNCGGTEAGKCPVIPTLGVGYACNLTAGGALDKCSGGNATCNTSGNIEVCQ